MAQGQSRNVCIVGLGHHAKRIYLPLVKELLVLVIDLESQRAKIEDALLDHGLREKVSLTCIPVSNELKLRHGTRKDLVKSLHDCAVSHLIIATDPKVHDEYIHLGLEAGVDILVDKPITAPLRLATDYRAAKQIERDYYRLIKLQTQHVRVRAGSIPTVTVQCQRRFHPGYTFIKSLVTKVVKGTNVPITSMSISHHDGMWCMPSEYARKSHSYNDGFGKLCHSGYHFVDLAVWLLDANRFAQESKRATSMQVYTSSARLGDMHHAETTKDIANLYRIDEDDEQLLCDEAVLSHCGETDVNSVVTFRTRSGHVACLLNLELGQTSFSARKSPKTPEDTYKGIGRIRSEAVTIRVGHIFEVKVISYQSQEAKDKIDSRFSSDDQLGAYNHFDIVILRNTKVFNSCRSIEQFSIRDIQSLERSLGIVELVDRVYAGEINDTNMISFCSKSSGKGFHGHNEEARRSCLDAFLEGGQLAESSLVQHEPSIKLLSAMYESLAHNQQGNIQQAVVHRNI